MTVFNVNATAFVPIKEMYHGRRRPVTYIKVVEDDALGKVTVHQLVAVTHHCSLR